MYGVTRSHSLLRPDRSEIGASSRPRRRNDLWGALGESPKIAYNRDATPMTHAAIRAAMVFERQRCTNNRRTKATATLATDVRDFVRSRNAPAMMESVQHNHSKRRALLAKAAAAKRRIAQLIA